MFLSLDQIGFLQLIESCQEALVYLQSKVDQAEIRIACSEDLDVVVRSQQVEQLSANQGKQVIIKVYCNGSEGVVSTTQSDFLSIKKACDKACDIARFTSYDKYMGLVDKRFLIHNNVQLNFQAEYLWQKTVADIIDQAKKTEAYALDSKKIESCESSEINCYRNNVWQGNSLGLSIEFAATSYSASVTCVAADKDRLARDYSYSSSRNAGQLLAPEVLATKAVQRTISRVGAVSVKEQAVPVLFSNELSRTLLGYFARAISGNLIYKKSSVFCGFLGKQVFPKYISILQDPHLDNAIGSKLFDSDGVATKKRHVVENGKLVSYVLGGYSAKRLGLEPTGNADGIQTWLIKDEQGLSFNNLLSKMDNGLYVTEMMGSGVDLTTGDFSQGVFGFWVEAGQIKYPVHEVTIAGNLKQMFGSCLGIGIDIDKRGVIQSGSMLVDKMVIAGSGS